MDPDPAAATPPAPLVLSSQLLGPARDDRVLPGKADRYVHLLRSLPAGPDGRAVHPAVGQEGTAVIDHRGIRRAWSTTRPPPGPGRPAPPVTWPGASTRTAVARSPAREVEMPR